MPVVNGVQSPRNSLRLFHMSGKNCKCNCSPSVQVCIVGTLSTHRNNAGTQNNGKNTPIHDGRSLVHNGDGSSAILVFTHVDIPPEPIRDIEVNRTTFIRLLVESLKELELAHCVSCHGIVKPPQ